MDNYVNREISPVQPPRTFDAPQLNTNLIQASSLIRAGEARTRFEVDGSGLTAAILDTGIRASHRDFQKGGQSRVIARRNFTCDFNSDPENASDNQGHGSNIAGIVAANGIHRGIAPGANLAALKVLDGTGGGCFTAVADALEWVLEHYATLQITVVNLSFGDRGNLSTDADIPPDDRIRVAARQLSEARVAVVTAAGNHYFEAGSAQGMSYPAILPYTISVGAVYDASVGRIEYGNAQEEGAIAFTTAPNRITPFSQRLHESVNRTAQTDIFAPGGPITSTGHTSDTGISIQHGTSQATPVTTGIILLLQHFYQRNTGETPPLEEIRECLRGGAAAVQDGDHEDDNVQNTGLIFRRIDAVGALETMQRRLEARLFAFGIAARTSPTPQTIRPRYLT
jgi:subtilisin family serine protease